LRCKDCVEEAERKEREAAEARRKIAKNKEGGISSTTEETHLCSGPCKRTMPVSSFNRNQLSKKEKARCRECVEKAIDEEKKNNEDKISKEIALAKENVKKAEQGGNAIEILKATNHLAALESQLVTGVKPKVLGRGRGSRTRRGRGR